ncbi:MAG: Omp28-related outer membrane protein [Lewinellaceae bacterium]|jgi:hypothetical protein|nr:Omp28-related outer membrane protein [Lewinellaceae bacterium]
MKNFTILSFAAAGFFFFSGCKEKPITIPELSVGGRNVLVEELTGVKCQNCPDGAALLNNLNNQFGGNLIVVSIHAAGFYSVPYSENKYDFRTPQGTELANFIGAAQGFPAASINRRLVPPETELYLSPSIWTGQIAEELKEEPTIGVFVETDFDPVSRKLDVAVNLAAESVLSGEHRLTVLITQDSIQDLQLVGTTKVYDYYHRHVLRTTLTQPTGNVIAETLSPSAVVQKQFSFVLPPDWEEKHCSVVAFVHHGIDPNKEVLQAAEEHVMK